MHYNQYFLKTGKKLKLLWHVSYIPYLNLVLSFIYVTLALSFLAVISYQYIAMNS